MDFIIVDRNRRLCKLSRRASSLIFIWPRCLFKRALEMDFGDAFHTLTKGMEEFSCVDSVIFYIFKSFLEA